MPAHRSSLTYTGPGCDSSRDLWTPGHCCERGQSPKREAHGLSTSPADQAAVRHWSRQLRSQRPGSCDSTHPAACRQPPQSLVMEKECMQDLPRRSSPKFPQPIFLPTRKLGPTIKTPELVPELRTPWLLRLVPVLDILRPSSNSPFPPFLSKSISLWYPGLSTVTLP